MDKGILGLVTAVALCGYSGIMAVTGKIVSELSLQRGAIHYPLQACDPEDPWHVDIWGAGYCRKACSAFECGSCDKHGSTTQTTSLSKLFFGKSCFRGQDAFPGGLLASPTGYPGLVFAKVCPDISYSEAGVFLGGHAQRDIGDSCWSVGCRASLPISRVEVQQRGGCNCEVWDDDACNLTACRQEFTNANPNDAGTCSTAYLGDGPKMNNVCAYRLDFLSTLLMPDGTPMVNYGDGSSDTTVANIPITIEAASAEAFKAKAVAPMYVLYAQDGNLANALLIGTVQSVLESNNLARNVGPDTPSDATEMAQWVLNADGTNHNQDISTNGDRLAFSQSVDYASGLGSNPAQQKQWFLVPNSTGEGIDAVLIDDANAVQNAVEYVLHSADSCAEGGISFFKKHCVDFAKSDCTVGAGDLYFEWYGGYHPACWYIDMLLGTKLPTGTKMCDARRIYWQPTGNNGHVELRGGLEGGWQYNWFALRGMLSYSHAFNHTERRAPAFVGATIKNIPVGCPVPARVHWGYFWGNLDMTFFHPQCANCGLVLGYELYAKQQDKVCFCNSEAKDFLGFTHKLENNVLEQGTNTHLNKVRGEIFYHIGCCECFGGGYYSFAGRCALKEMEFHIGAAIYF
jgi:hypothetical protein